MRTTLFSLILLVSVVIMGASSCEQNKDSDSSQREQQERILSEGTAQTGMPAIHNFRERKILKDIYEKRDQGGFVTYTYLWNEFNGKLVFFCNSIGYGIPYATQYSNPQKDIYYTTSSSYHMALPQAEPNGLFSPASADGTWIMCKNPNGKDVQPVYVEPHIVTSPFPLK
jgi:hypothetical protein